MRPWIETPSWDGKIVLAALFTAGYFYIIHMLVGPGRADLSEHQKELAIVALAALGPQLGQIFGSIYRTTAADERDAERRTETLQRAIETPSAPAPAPDLDDQVEEGARKGSREGVAEGLQNERTAPGAAAGMGPASPLATAAEPEILK